MQNFVKGLLATAMFSGLVHAVPTPASSRGQRLSRTAVNMTEHVAQVYEKYWNNPLKRQDQYDTNYEIRDSLAYANVAGADEPPTQFDELFDSLRGELCGSFGCDLGASKCIPNGLDGVDLCISVDGNFPGGAAQRDDYITLAREIFYREATHIVFPGGEGPIEPFNGYRTDSAQYIIVAGPGDYSGSNLNIRFEVQGNPAANCPAALETIAGIGATLPGVSPIFGAIGLVCPGGETTVIQAGG